MKVLINSYNNVFQHDGGGIQMRVKNFFAQYKAIPDVEVKLFNKWEDKLRDFQILHEFKVTVESYSILSAAKEEGLKTVISSVVPQINATKIRTLVKLGNLIPSNLAQFTRDTLLMADAIIAQTKKEATFINHNYGIPIKKIHILPNGVNDKILQSYNPDLNTRDIVLNVGRFDHNKNQLSLIRAALKTNYEVHFVGGKALDDSDYYDQCLKEAQGARNIHFHGWLSNTSDEFLSLYQRARVVTLLSHNEIFGNSLIEGAACGANLVATNVLPIDEYGFNDHCVRIDPDDEDDICSGLIKAYEKPLDNTLHEIAETRFSWRSIALRQLDIYKTLLSS